MKSILRNNNISIRLGFLKRKKKTTIKILIFQASPRKILKIPMMTDAKEALKKQYTSNYSIRKQFVLQWCKLS